MISHVRCFGNLETHLPSTTSLHSGSLLTSRAKLPPNQEMCLVSHLAEAGVGTPGDSGMECGLLSCRARPSPSLQLHLALNTPPSSIPSCSLGPDGSFPHHQCTFEQGLPSVWTLLSPFSTWTMPTYPSDSAQTSPSLERKSLRPPTLPEHVVHAFGIITGMWLFLDGHCMFLRSRILHCCLLCPQPRTWPSSGEDV